MSNQVSGTLVYEDDAGIHPVGPQPDWRESYYLNFASIDGDISGIVWQGVRPNNGVGEEVFVLYEGTNPLLESINMAVPVPTDIGPERNRMVHQEFECVEPWRRWRIKYDDGTDRVEIEWTQLSDMCNWLWQDVQDSIHYQGSGRIKGTAVIGGREFAFTGYGDRDRAWGKRNYGPLEFAANLFMQFEDDSMLHSFVMPDGAGGWRLHGYLHRDGLTRDLASYEVAYTYDEEGRPPIDAVHKGVDVDGRVIEVSQSTLMHAIEYATAADGANLGSREEAVPGVGKRMFLASYRYTQPSGVRGVGCLDHNFWWGKQPIAFKVDGPVFSKNYGFGRGVNPRDPYCD